MPVLFVYGTLRRPVGGPASDTHYHSRIADTIVIAEMASLFGAAIYDCGNFPGIAAADESLSVRGEVFEVSDAALLIADEIEGHPEFYERRETEIVLDNGTGGPAWVYWAPPATIAHGVRIDSGDWFDRPRTEPAVSVDEQLASERSRLDSTNN